MAAARTDHKQIITTTVGAIKRNSYSDGNILNRKEVYIMPFLTNEDIKERKEQGARMYKLDCG